MQERPRFEPDPHLERPDRTGRLPANWASSSPSGWAGRIERIVTPCGSRKLDLRALGYSTTGFPIQHTRLARLLRGAPTTESGSR